MKKTLLLLAVAAMTLLTAACSKYKYETVKNDPLQTRIYTLDNGLKVYMSVNKEKPRIQTSIAVKVGGKNDPSETTGLAHYFEHLMFKGTQQFGTSNYEAEKPMLDQVEALFEVYRNTTDEAERKELYRQIDSISYEASKYAIPNEYDKLMSAIGATGTNAYTSMDETVYVENIPSNQIENWARIQADRFQNPVIRGFHTELETIYEEKNMSLTNDSRKVYTAIGEVLFPHHPYGTQTVLGTQEDLKNPSITNVRNYHKTFYVPNNMAICIAGDFDPDEMIQIIDKYFGAMVPNKDLPQLTFAEEAPITKPIVKEVFGPDAENVTLVWRSGSKASEDAAYALLASQVLYNGVAGMLDLDLVQQQKVLNAYAYVDQRADYGAMVVYGRPKSGQTLDEVRDLLLQQVAKFRNGEFDEELLKAVVNNLKVSMMKEIEHNQGRVDLFVDSFIGGIPWKDQVDQIARIEAITKEQLVAWAAKTMGPENYGLIYKRTGTDPNVQKIAKPELTPIVMNRDMQSEFLTEIQNTKVKPIEPVFVDYKRDMEIFTTDSGLEVLYKKNTTNDLFSMTFLFETGLVDDPSLNIAFNYMDYLGTMAKTAAQIASELYDIACYYNLGTDQNSSYVTFYGLSENMGTVMEIFEDLVANAQGDEEILANYKADLLKARENSKLNQSTNFNALMRYAFFGGEAIKRITLTNDQLTALKSDELLAKVRDLLNKQHTILYYGPDSKEKLLEVLKEHHHTPETMEPLQSQHLNYMPTNENSVLLANYDAQQLYFLQFTNLDRKFDVTVDPAQRLYNEYTSGSMNSIVFQEMRESRSLAYTAVTDWMTPDFKDQNYAFGALIATQNDKMAQAIDAFAEIINNMPESEAAFNLAKESILSTIRTARTIKEAVLWSYVYNRDLGVTEDRNKAIFEKVQTMTLEDLKAVQQEWIKDRKYTYCILGDLKDLDQEYLRNLGPVKVLGQEELFGY